jgi:hypothetical protein
MAGWFKSTRSMENGACIEVCFTHVVRVRDSTDPTGPVLAFDVLAWREFVKGMQ